MFQFPYPAPPDPPLTHSDQICTFIVLYTVLLALIGLCLPRPFFVKCFKVLFPFMPDRLPREEPRDDR